MKQQTNLKPLINRNQILMIFEKYGYPADSMINKQRMISIFRAEYVKKRQTFDSKHIIQQIWDQSQATSKGQICIKTIADILEQAQNILQKRISALTGSNGMIENLDKNIKQKQQQLKQFAKYYGEQRDQINRLTKQLMNMIIQQQQNRFDLKSFRQDYQAINAIFSIQQLHNFTQYILPPKQPQIKLQKSNKLLTLFHITSILFLLDLLILSSLRLAMLTLTVLLHSYYLLLFGIEDPASYTYILLHYLFCIITDIAFIVIYFKNNFQIMPIQHSSHSIYVIMMVVFLIGSIALRIFSMIIYLNLGSTHNSKVVNYFLVLGQIFPPNKIQQQPQYAFYLKENHQSVFDQTNKKQSLYMTQIKDPANYHINIKSRPRETYIEYSSIQNYMDMKQ